MDPEKTADPVRVVRRGARFRQLFWLWMAAFWSIVATATAAGGKSVLVVYADERLLPANAEVDEAIRARLALGPSSTLTYYSEFMDVVRFPGREHDRRLAEFLRGRYAGKTIDVIISPGPLALEFLLRHRSDLFPAVPIVYCVLTSEEVTSLAPPADVIGVPEDFDPRPTIEMALRLHPRARELVFVTGASRFDKVWEERLRRLAPGFERRVRVRHFAGRPLEELLRELSKLPADSVVFTPTFLRDGAGRPFIARNTLILMDRVSTAPIYGVYSTGIGFGLTGARTATFEAIGNQAAEIALRILSGENPATMKLPGQVPPDYVFDWRRLRRWGVGEKSLPAGSIVRFRQPTFWEANQWFVLGGVALCIVEALLITALLIHRARRRSAEEGLRDSEHRMSLAVSATGIGVWNWDVLGDEIWMTEEGRALFGFGKSERIDLERFLQAVHPDDRERVRQRTAQLLVAGGEYEREYRVVCPDGQMRWIAGRGRVEAKDGRPVRVRGVSLDITRRKLAEERSELVVEAAPNALVMVNPEGRITLVNAAVEKVFGYSRQELIGQPVEILVPGKFRGQHPGNRGGYLAHPEVRAMGAGRELFGRRKDGREVPVEIGLNPIQTPDGLFVLASVIDIAQRKQSELEAERQRNELAHLSRVTMLGELSGSLAHELNQPLTSILSNAQAALRFLAHGNDLDEVREILKDIVEEDRHAGEVIRRLRLLLKKGEVHHEPLDVAEVVRDVLRLVRSDLVNQGVAAATELPSHLPAVRGDRVQLQQVLLNLVMNGCDAMAGTPAADRELVVRAEAADGDGVHVSVSDNGSGIPDDQTDRIFDPFFTTKEHGMGLGLAVCRTIIAAHGGRLWAAGNNGRRGATLHFTLPASGQSAGPAAS